MQAGPTLEPFRHAEELRPGVSGPGDVELVLAHPIGATEVAHGRIEGTAMSLHVEADLRRSP